jgi:hypothetical protein
MRKLLVCGMVAAAAFAVVAGSGMSKESKEKKVAKNPNLGKLRHVVLFQFKEGTKADEIKKIEGEFRALRSKIPTVVDYEWGTNNSPEGLADGFTHCFLVTFDDEKGRAVYLPHPAHQEYVGILKPHLEKVLVIDYVARD